MNNIDSLHEDVRYDITNQEVESCGDCLECQNKCETGRGMMSNMGWTIKEVEDACSLVTESNKFLKQLKSLEELK